MRPEGADRSLTRAPQPEDEEDVEPALEELEQREVLVLGLDASDTSQIDPYLRQGLGDLDIPQGVTVFSGPPNVADNIMTDAQGKARERNAQLPWHWSP